MISKTRSIFRGTLVTIAILLLLICLIIPWALNIWLLPTIGEQFGVKYSASNIWLNPITGTVTIEKGIIKQQQSPFFKWHELRADISMRQLLNRRIVIEQIAVIEPALWLQRDKQNVWNFESLTLPDNKDAETTDQKTIDFAIQEAFIKDGHIYYGAYQNDAPVNYQLNDINFLLENLTSDFSQSFKTKLDLAAASDGLLSWQGETALIPLLVKGEAAIQQINIPAILQLLPLTLPVNLKQGELREFKTEIEVKKQQKNLAVSLEKIVIGLDKLDLKLAKKEQAKLTVDNFTLNDGSFKWPANQLNLGKWQIENIVWRGKLDQQRQLNWVTAFQTKEETQPKNNTLKDTTKESTTKLWQISWHQGAITNSQLSLNDLSIQPEANHQLTLAEVSAKAWNNQKKQPLQINAKGQLAAGGKFKLSSDIHLNPLQLETEAELDEFLVDPYQRYWQPFLAAELQGAIKTKVKAKWQPDNETEPYQMAGDFQWDNWLLKETKTNKLIGQGKQLSLQGISLLPNKLNITAIALNSPKVFLQREPEQQWNFSPLLPQANKAQAKTNSNQTTSQQNDTKPWEWFIGAIEIKEGDLDFRDETVTPVAELNLSKIFGKIKQLSSEEKKSNLQLSALIADSDLKIEGELIPLNPRKLASIKFAANNMSLPIFSSYAAKYLGYPIKRGKLGATLYYNVKDFSLQSDNKVTLNKLKLGNKTASKEAVDAPVKLALALLEDSKGKIALDVPVKGDFSKPDVKYGQLVVDAVLKIFKSIAASPFNLLGGLVDFSGTDVNLIKFKPGSYELPKTEQEKLVAIIKLLNKRPNLILEVEGQFDTEQDKPGLAQQTILDNIKKDLGEIESISDKQKKRWLMAQLDKEGIITNDSMTIEFLTRLYTGTVKVKNNSLTSLAKRRAKVVSEYIVRQGNINKERIYTLDVKDIKEKVKGDVSTVLTINAP
ncbi:DUF748 domain-containing protein [Spartinivicinus ruber]|uniref:DUF748 domain-containing protein n=1 Tax=Spartinivicinus ruber TaxID=2683272 RepID=UPI0013D12924|nr:DUF748 domain-containing protein [Spartinivicinus ruber]